MFARGASMLPCVLCLFSRAAASRAPWPWARSHCACAPEFDARCPAMRLGEARRWPHRSMGRGGVSSPAAGKTPHRVFSPRRVRPDAAKSGILNARRKEKGYVERACAQPVQRGGRAAKRGLRGGEIRRGPRVHRAFVRVLHGVDDGVLFGACGCGAGAAGLLAAGRGGGSGLGIGCGAGLLLSRFLHLSLMTRYFGIAWSLPLPLLCIIVLYEVFAVFIAVYTPAKRIRNMAITETINEL